MHGSQVPEPRLSLQGEVSLAPLLRIVYPTWGFLLSTHVLMLSFKSKLYKWCQHWAFLYQTFTVLYNCAKLIYKRCCLGSPLKVYNSCCFAQCGQIQFFVQVSKSGFVLLHNDSKNPKSTQDIPAVPEKGIINLLKLKTICWKFLKGLWLWYS